MKKLSECPFCVFEEIIMSPGDVVEIIDTAMEKFAQNRAVIIDGPNRYDQYLVEMITGVQWRCPSWRIKVI